jgi:hypothetical protein
MPIEVSLMRVLPRQKLTPHARPDPLPAPAARSAVCPVQRRFLRDQIVRADLVIRQRRQRNVKIIGGVVNHQHFDARIGRLRRMARIQLIAIAIDNAFFAGAARQQQRQQYACPASSSAGLHRRAADAHHQHAAIFTDRFVVNINADHRIGAQRFRLLAQLFKRNFTRLTQLFS